MVNWLGDRGRRTIQRHRLSRGRPPGQVLRCGSPGHELRRVRSARNDHFSGLRSDGDDNGFDSERNTPEFRDALENAGITSSQFSQYINERVFATRIVTLTGTAPKRRDPGRGKRHVSLRRRHCRDLHRAEHRGGTFRQLRRALDVPSIERHVGVRSTIRCTCTSGGGAVRDPGYYGSWSFRAFHGGNG